MGNEAAGATEAGHYSDRAIPSISDPTTTNPWVPVPQGCSHGGLRQKRGLVWGQPVSIPDGFLAFDLGPAGNTRMCTCGKDGARIGSALPLSPVRMHILYCLCMFGVLYGDF